MNDEHIQSNEQPHGEKVLDEAEFDLRKQSLLRNKDYLSDEGRALLSRLEAIQDTGENQTEKQEILDLLPTIEDPKLELFSDVMSDIDEDTRDGVLLRLGGVQVTQGCSHQCVHCAAGASEHIERMPYVVAAKVASASEERSTFRREKNNEAGNRVLAQLRDGVVDRDTIRAYFEGYRIFEPRDYNDYALKPAEILRTRAAFWGSLIGSQADRYRVICEDYLRSAATRVPGVSELDYKSTDRATIAQLQKEVILAFKDSILNKLERNPFWAEALQDGDDIGEVNRTALNNALTQYMDRAMGDSSGDVYFGDVVIDRTHHNIVSRDIEKAIITAVAGDVTLVDFWKKEEGATGGFENFSNDRDHPFFTGTDRLLPGRYSLDNLVSPIGKKECVMYGAMLNYADSDPFDYRDLSIRHADGTPADYSDIYKLFNVDNANICVVTAGWRSSDKIAQRAGEELKRIGARIDLSVHYFSNLARQDKDAYRESIKNVIKTMHPNINFRIFGDEAKELVRGLLTELGFGGGSDLHAMQVVSTYSGRGKEFADDPIFEDFDKESWDVMDSTPGFIILPDGKIQRKFLQEEPVETGISLF